ncbi:MAG TPA: serine hydrolase domain-containing protein [Anaeromyxobacteraceae bacterium]|nr:serine hydrolase domain-containing protein [Anaeromyxobacteraceae bacterium]
MTEIPALSVALEAGRRAGIAPALSAAVLSGGKLVHASWHGEIPDPEPRPLRRDDLFDGASLTKVLATATLAAILVDEGALDLDAPAARWLPGFEREGKDRVTVRNLLAHASGLPWWRPYHERAAADPVAGLAFLPPGRRPPAGALREAFARGREIVRESVLAERLEAEPGTRAVYGDPAYLALGFVVEAAGGEPLARLAGRRVFGPLGLASTLFRDGLDPDGAGAGAAGRSFAPCRRSAPRGGEVVQGAVDDDNAWAVGGAAGHAGLFSTATDVAAIGQAWLEAVDGRRTVVPGVTAREFVRLDPTPSSGRALGWDTPSRGSTSLGTRLGRGRRGAIGHLGFTGTSLWIDLDREVVVALLTNHCHPAGPDRPRMLEFRRGFHDAVADALGV